MATFRSDAGGTRFQPYTRPEGAAIVQPFTYTINAALVSGDIVVLCNLPPGCTVTSFYVDSPRLDGGGVSASATCTIGDQNTANKFATIAAGTLNTDFRFSSMVSPTAAGVTDGADLQTLPAVYSTSNDIRMAIAGTVNAAGNTGTIKGAVTYCMQPLYSDPKL